MRFKILQIISLAVPLFANAQAYKNGEVFIGEISETRASVSLADSVVFYVEKGERFYARYTLSKKSFFTVTLADGRNGKLVSDKVIRSADQTLFKITYPESFYPFAKEPSVYGTSYYSNCSYASMDYWLSYFLDTTDFTGLSEKAFHKDTSALYQLLTGNGLDSDGHAHWGYNSWKLINAYTDKELAVFLFNRISNYKGYHVSNLILPYYVQTPVFGDEQRLMLNYYETHYPLTYTIYLLEQTTNKRDFNKAYQKLKKVLSGS